MAKINMIRIELGEEIERRGKWRWRCSGYGVEGISRQPLLDACREIKRMGGDTCARVGLFRKGSLEPDLSCVLGVGAELTVDETTTRFRKWYPAPIGLFDKAGAALAGPLP